MKHHHQAVRAGLILLRLAFGVAFLLSASVSASSASQFASDQLRFDAAALSFQADSLSFTSAPIQNETATTIEITLPADILFDFDKADIRATARQALQEVAVLIREKSAGPVTVQGYTDALGKDGYNQKLSERRANAVKAWFVAQEGLPAIRFKTAGFGPRNPVAPNAKPDGTDDPEGRQLNRRVTLILRK